MKRMSGYIVEVNGKCVAIVAVDHNAHIAAELKARYPKSKGWDHFTYAVSRFAKSPKAAQELGEQVRRELESQRRRPGIHLSRPLEILRRLAAGESQSDIARSLGISRQAVSSIKRRAETGKGAGGRG